ncbi:MAG: TonB-dependent receptor [Candidatus Omnitrophica bacterium]|nr:TonB-dependent receptor [Candidatus Omnitrophota bacterium]
MKKKVKVACLVFFWQVVFGHGHALAATEERDLDKIVVKRLPYGSVGNGPVAGALTRQDIEKLPAKTPQELLAYVGVDVQNRGVPGIKADISLNGSTFQQVLVLVNGVRVKDPQTAHQDLDLFFSVDDIERIEVVPASASAKFGPDGIGGAVNFVLKSPEKGRNSLTASGGNNTTAQQGLDFYYKVLGAENRFSVWNFSTAGSRYDTDARMSNFLSSSRLIGNNVSFYLDAGYNEKEYGAYDFYTPGRGFPSKEWINVKNVDARMMIEGERFSFEPRFSFRQLYDKFMLTIQNPSLYLNHHRTDVLTASGTLTVPRETGSFAAGAEYGTEHIVSSNLGDHTRSHWSLSAEPSWDLSEKTSFGAVVRMDDYSTFKEEVTGSAMLKSALNPGEDIYASFGRLMRIPTFTELYYSDPTTAGNSGLRPETAYSFESGWNKRLRDGLLVNLGGFIRQEFDTIDFTKESPSDPKFTARNISEALTFGVNLYGRWDASETFSCDLRYLYTNKTFKDDGLIYKYGFAYLQHMIDLGLEHRLGAWRNRADVLMKKKPQRRAWVIVSDKLSVDIGRHWQVFFEVYNLFNAEFQDIEGIPEQGRTVNLGATLNW